MITCETEYMFDMISETFKNRRQIVKFQNVFSKETIVSSGVLQGGVLSPTLFNIYISDIVRNIKSKIFYFADDLCIVCPINTVEDCLKLQIDLNEIYCYCEENSLKLNPMKCEFMRIYSRNSPEFSYKINGNCIKSVQIHKHIGVIYDYKMAFNSHIDNIVIKALKKFSLLKYICNRVNGKTFLRLYLTYILPILEFCNLSLVLNKTQTIRLESVQRNVTKYICYKMRKYDLTYENRLEFLNIYTLEKRRKIQILKIVYKIKNRLYECKNKWFNELFFYNTTRNGSFCKIPIKHNVKEFFINASKIYNSLPQNIRSENKYRKFVNYLELYF